MIKEVESRNIRAENPLQRKPDHPAYKDRPDRETMQANVARWVTRIEEDDLWLLWCSAARAVADMNGGDREQKRRNTQTRSRLFESGKKVHEFGNNPYPVVKDEDALCCDECNDREVIPARLNTAG